MRKALSCVLMITLLLSGCRAGSAGAGQTPEEEALAVREAYQNLAGWSAGVDVTAEVGEKVFDFTLDAVWRREGETVLEYDGAGLSLGLLDGSGLTPMSAVTGLMAQVEKGYMAKCVWAGEGEELLQITFRDPELAPNEGTEYQLTFDRASRALLGAEASVAGKTVLTAQFTNFTMEEQQDDTGDGA